MIQIITDTASLLDVKQGKEINVKVIPLQVTIAGKTYREFEEINSEQYYKLIQEGNLPKSSQPSIGEVVEVFDSCNKTDDILNLTIADGLSGAYQTACMAKEQSKNAERIHVLNTRTLCGPLNHLVLLASRLRNDGKSLQEIKERLEHSMEHCVSFLMPQDFNYLKRNGRLTPLAAKLGGILKIQPVLIQTADGKRLDKFHIGRTFGKSIDAIIKEMKHRLVDDKYITYVSHAFALEQAQAAIKKIQAAFPNMEVKLLELSPAFITQGGPQTIAIQSILK
ncbi:MAG: DegV family protein [Erysipelotrichaceae bacterium]|nr:DegV family protein [Erysipelotrichaceae bacterium]